MCIKAPIAVKRKGVYKFVIRQDVIFETHISNISFDKEWLKIEKSGKVTVKGSLGEGYAWDGCTPKLNILDLFLLGIPDGRVIVNTNQPITYYASLIHDALCQFHVEAGLPRKEADKVFLKYLGDFNLRYMYYFAVRVYGLFKSF